MSVSFIELVVVLCKHERQPGTILTNETCWNCTPVRVPMGMSLAMIISGVADCSRSCCAYNGTCGLLGEVESMRGNIGLPHEEQTAVS